MTQAPPAPPRVAIYRAPLLPLSETFIRDQTLALARWQPTLMGEMLVRPSPPLAGIAVHTAYAEGRWGLAQRKFDRACELLLGHSPRKRGLLRAIGPRLVHVHFATDAVRIWPTVSHMGLPLLVTLHGYDITTHADWWRAGHGGDFMRSYPDLLLAMARHPSVHFVAVSDAIRRTAIDYGLPAGRIEVHHIGIHTSRFTREGTVPSQRGRDVLFVGRLVEKKGARFLIEAAALLRERVPGLRLVVLGDGPERASLEAQARQQGVQAQFLGAQPHEQVRRQLASARAFCLPSVTATNGDAEGFGIVLLEAQSVGVPVVTSAKGGSDEGVLDGLTGFAFAEGDVARLAASLEILMLDDARVDAMSQRAECFVRERFDIAHCTRSLEDLYDRLAAASAL